MYTVNISYTHSYYKTTFFLFKKYPILCDLKMTCNQIAYQFYHIKISLDTFIFVWHFLNVSGYLDTHIFLFFYFHDTKNISLLIELLTY